MRIAIVGLGGSLCALLFVFPLAVSADEVGERDEVAELRRMVEEQGRLIEALQEQVARLTEPSAPAAVAAGPPGAGSPGVQPAVSAAYVDERIQDFEEGPVSRFLLSGYGTAFLAVDEGGPDAFGASFTPGFHYRMSDRLHFNAELEIELEAEDGELDTHFGLEFAQVDWLATDWLTLSGGKILTPFATFGPRLHPSWINKLATPPPIYGHGEGGGGMIPILTSVGAMTSGGTALWNEDAKLDYAFYVGNGPTAVEDPMDAAEILDIEFDNTLNLDNVATGGRVGFLPIANLEIGASYTTGAPNGDRFNLAGLDGWYFHKGLELRGEMAYLNRKVSGNDADVWGYWVQSAYRLRYLFPDRTGVKGFLNRLEGVVRWGQIFDFDPLDRKQVAFGLNYWLFESAPLKLTYEVNSGAFDNDRFFLQFAYGF